MTPRYQIRNPDWHKLKQWVTERQDSYSLDDEPANLFYDVLQTMEKIEQENIYFITEVMGGLS